jgi:hypothetical protein
MWKSVSCVSEGKRTNIEVALCLAHRQGAKRAVQGSQLLNGAVTELKQTFDIQRLKINSKPFPFYRI